MKIDLRNISPDGLKIEINEPVKILNIEVPGAEFKEPVKVSILVNRTGNTLLVNGGIRTSAGMECSRCLKKIKRLLENKNFNITRDITGQTEVDLTPDIREEIVLLLPTKPLCKEDCKGLCPSCGQDLNEKKCSCKPSTGQIRWERLNKLKLE